MTTDMQRIEAQFRDGTLLESIESGAEEKAALLEACVELHNTGRVDLISLVERGAHERLLRHDFFSVMHFYCKAIPRLEGVLVTRMMTCVARLVQAGGTDMAAGLPNSALREWCAADTSRADEIVEHARRADGLAIDHLTYALQAKGGTASRT